MIAEYPRKAMTDRYFLRGIKKNEEENLITAMNVAGDHLVTRNGLSRDVSRAERELDLIKKLAEAPSDALARCKAIWTLITNEDEEEVNKIVNSVLEARASDR